MNTLINVQLTVAAIIGISIIIDIVNNIRKAK